MSFQFRDVPVGQSRVVRRPIVDIVVDGFSAAPQAFLIDTGAAAIRMSAEVGEALGIGFLQDAPERLAVGGAIVDAHEATVTLGLALGDTLHEWEAPVWFCEPWPQAFGLLGLRGFLDCFDLSLSGYDERFVLVSRLQG